MEKTNEATYARLREAMVSKCHAHISRGEFCAAFELILVGMCLDDGDSESAHQWLIDYRENLD